MAQPNIIVLDTNQQRETGREAQLSNMQAALAVQDLIRTTLGPQAMLKMILDPIGGVVLTNDGNAILREIDVSHPAAKSIIELARTQDEEVGDGTTSVIILAAEMLIAAKPFIERGIHPTLIVQAYRSAQDVAIDALKKLSFNIDIHNPEQLLQVVLSACGTKFISRFGDHFCRLAITAVQTVVDPNNEDARFSIDLKNFVKIEKVPGGEMLQSEVLAGIMLDKDVTHPRMPRRVENPRIVLLDCPLEYKKGESQTNVEFSRGEHFNAVLRLEEEYIERICSDILKVKPNVVITEKGVSDLAQHFLARAGVACIRRVKKTDNNRIARAVGANIVNRTEELSDNDVGTGCGLFEVSKIGDEYFTYLVKCVNPRACTIVLRGASKDILQEIHRNLDDAMGVCRSLVNNPRCVYGGGACEMAISRILTDYARSVKGVEQGPFKAVASALEVIPKTLIDNCGAQTIRLLTELRAKHAEGLSTWGIDGKKGVLVDMQEHRIIEAYEVKAQTIKTAVESAVMLVRVDEILSSTEKREQ